MKELYQQAVADSERITKVNAVEEIQHATNARSIKEKFERGESIPASDDVNENKEKPDEEVIAAGKIVHFFFFTFYKRNFYFCQKWRSNKIIFSLILRKWKSRHFLIN